MIVYGDPAYCIAPGEISARLCEVENARDLLIACGQIEQGVADSGADATVVEGCTDLAAEAFLDAPQFASPAVKTAIAVALARIQGPLRIKIPEGFAFYCLYPEQYARAAEAWMLTASQESPVFVAGVRSIGTSLSALVRAVLARAGFSVSRGTIRPRGDPFNRTVELPRNLDACKAAIVVDEGPGLSGSSMAAVARALRERGIADITFFPSHRGEPGNAASPEVRAIWSETKRIACPLIGADFRESCVYGRILKSSEEFLNSPVTAAVDISGGNWRSFFDKGELLPATPVFERSKYLLTAENGRKVIWKFAGISLGRKMRALAGDAMARQEHLARGGWTLPAAGAVDGFIATEWFDAPRLRAADLKRIGPANLARYVRECSRQPLDRAVQRDSFERLLHMARCNLVERFGEGAEREVVRAADKVAFDRVMPAYGDGRLAPHEWFFRDGSVVKTDVWGHESDHTCIGEQPVLWDIAGAVIEWDMDAAARDEFLSAFARHGLCVSVAELNFYLEAYRAWRTGLGMR